MSIIVGEGWLFLSIILRIYSIGTEFYTAPDSVPVLHGPMAYEPMLVMERVDYYVGTMDSLFCFDFLKYALSAGVIIIAAGIGGYICMKRSDIV